MSNQSENESNELVKKAPLACLVHTGQDFRLPVLRSPAEPDAPLDRAHTVLMTNQNLAVRMPQAETKE